MALNMPLTHACFLSHALGHVLTDFSFVPLSLFYQRNG